MLVGLFVQSSCVMVLIEMEVWLVCDASLAHLIILEVGLVLFYVLFGLMP